MTAAGSIADGHLYIHQVSSVSDSIAGFDWDEGNLPKCQSHGVTISEIEAAFRSPIRVFPAPAHSAAETRYVGIGRTTSGRHLLVAFTYRGIDKLRLVRPISARFMHEKEVSHYEEQTQASEKASSSGE
jgi:uncharacterized protein